MTVTLIQTVQVFGGELGVNYNGVFSQIDRADLTRTKAHWIRGFVDYYQFKNGSRSLRSDAGLKKFALAHSQGYKTIINLKFNFENRDLPIGPAAIRRELSYLETVLDAVYDDTELLVCGNEPFIESKIAQRDARLSNFYKAVALRVKAYREGQVRKVPLYIGAFNNLWKPSWQTQAAADLLQFAQTSPWIAGIDLHIHHTLLSDIDEAFEFVNPRIRGDQKILVTEFSLKNEWKLHLRDPIPSILVTEYNRPSGWQVYQYLNFTIHSPVSRAEWVDFLRNSSWFESRKDYLTTAWRKFAANPKFQVATYGLYQNAPKIFTAKTDPWIINPLIVNQTVVRDPKTGRYQANYEFLKEFIALQSGQKE
ncbi:MAG: hypothetical protein K1X67_21360 [Fimbriimonadaceae bacterium]|nr:hypothetical protein [Fimbriimonadaceae bacterium]